MVFSSTLFLFVFLPILMAVYFLAKDKFSNIILLVASLIFYAWGEPQNIVIMVLSIGVNYLLGFAVAKEWKARKWFLVTAIVYNIGILFVFKYLNFAVDTVNRITGRNIEILQIALPIGISFYTFQIMSYVIDVYRGNAKVQKNILNLGLYISLFPQLIAGPIVRYVDIEKQISHRTTSWDKGREGVLRFMVGFSKKILIADQLSYLADICFSGTYPSVLLNWIGIVAYTLQIYFDFSGYSDMAIGLGKIFGFDFLENFNYPYISQSIQEFWRRWHISLSTWFRDYLYIPLGGSKKGNIRTYINLVIVFFLTGLWHGASYNFIIWGLFYAVFLIIERMGFKKVLEKIPRVFRHFYAVIIVMIGWVFFRADNLTGAIQYIKGMCLSSGKDIENFCFIMNGQYWFCIIMGIIFSIPHPKLKSVIHKNSVTELVSDICILVVFVIAVCYMVGSGYSPFLYFRF